MLITISVSTGVDEHGDSSELPALVYQTTDNHVTDLTEGDVYHKVKLGPANWRIGA